MRIGTILRSVLILLLAVFIVFSVTATHYEPSTAPVTDIPEKQALTVSDIRKAAPLDVDVGDPLSDTVCFAVYNGFMTLEEGLFHPFNAVTELDAANAINKLGGDIAPATPKNFISRGELAEMLYATAKKQGLDLTVSGDADSNAVIWAAEKGLFSSFSGPYPQNEIAVSRLQFAAALTKFAALCADYELSVEIADKIPDRKAESVSALHHAAIEEAIAVAAEKYGAVGVQVAVIEKGTVTDSFAWGWATKDTDKMTVNHKLRAASITKVAVGAAAMLLREDGIIDLDESIGKYWGFETRNPHFPNDPITVRNILNHCSSFKNDSLNAPRNYNHLKTQLQGSGFSPNKPGNIEKWSYNNHAFAMLGVTLELAANKTLDSYMTEKVFAPLGMDASFYPPGVKNTDLLATIYNKDDKVGLSTQKAKTWKAHKKPGETGDPYSGGLTASACDVAKFFSVLANDGVYEGVRIMDAESVALMESCSENPVRYGFYQAMPLRYQKELYGREGIYFHTGSSMGMYNSATYDPESGDGVIIMSTGANGAKGEAQIYKICEEINQYIYDLLN